MGGGDGVGFGAGCYDKLALYGRLFAAMTLFRPHPGDGSSWRVQNKYTHQSTMAMPRRLAAKIACAKDNQTF